MKYQPADKGNPERPSMGLLNCNRSVMMMMMMMMMMMIKWHSKKLLVFFERKIFVACKAGTTLSAVPYFQS
jgi:hypothetical protein